MIVPDYGIGMIGIAYNYYGDGMNLVPLMRRNAADSADDDDWKGDCPHENIVVGRKKTTNYRYGNDYYNDDRKDGGDGGDDDDDDDEMDDRWMIGREKNVVSKRLMMRKNDPYFISVGFRFFWTTLFSQNHLLYIPYYRFICNIYI